MKRSFAFRAGVLGASVVSIAMLAGCSGGSSVGTPAVSEGNEMTFGSFVTRAIGTNQPPVVASGADSVVTGIAGASFTEVSELKFGPSTLNDTKILFERVTSGNNVDIYSMNVDGTGVVNLTNTANASESGAAWSPDGTKIIYSRGNDLYTMNANGTTQTNITNTANDVESAPVYSPDGARIAFVRGGDIFVANANGTGAQNRTSTANIRESNPSWSPDGTLIAYARENDLYTMNATGGNNRNLTDSANVNESAPVWSPNGQRIAYVGVEGDRADIYVQEVNGFGNFPPVNLTNSNDRQESGPSWSPDSTRVLYTGTLNGSVEIFSTDASFNFPGEEVNISKTLNTNELTTSARAWSPFLRPAPRKFIGSGGVLSSSAAGFMYGISGKTRTSILSFDTTSTALADRSATRVAVPEGVTFASNLVFSITAGDRTLGSVRFINGDNPSSAPVNFAVGSGAPVASAGAVLVYFDGEDGQVVSVLPYNPTRSVSGPQVSKEGDTIVFKGNFLAAVNGQGKNVAPNGATVVRVNSKTKQVIAP